MPKSTPGNLTSCTSLGRLSSLHQGISNMNRWHNLPEELPAAFAIIKLSRLEMTSKLSNPTWPGSKGKERCDVLAVGWGGVHCCGMLRVAQGRRDNSPAEWNIRAGVSPGNLAEGESCSREVGTGKVPAAI